MDHDVGSHTWTCPPFKRKKCINHHRVCSEKSSRCEAIIPNKFKNKSTITNMALNPLQKPRFNEGKGVQRRYNPFSIQKMVRLVKSQTQFLCQFINTPNWTSEDAHKFKEAAYHIGVCKAEPTSSCLAFFYLATTTIRGTCIAKNKYRKCIILGMEYRSKAPSFRIYMAYFSPTRFYYICYIHFLIRQLLISFGGDIQLAKTIMEYCFYGLVRKGFEIIGAHYMNPKEAKGKPQICMTKSKHIRYFTSLWDNQIQGSVQNGINFLVKHARRDVQVFELRVESQLYKNLLCGK